MRERITGYQEAAEAAGLDFDRLPVVEAGGFDLTAGVPAAHSLLAGHDVTAAVVTSDTMAIAVLEAAERGLRVPEDVSVVGFDDAPEAGSPRPDHHPAADGPKRTAGRRAVVRPPARRSEAGERVLAHRTGAAPHLRPAATRATVAGRKPSLVAAGGSAGYVGRRDG
ncbi:substrate-binding domain-containing protein [Amycolatopsis sp. NPDC003731]